MEFYLPRLELVPDVHGELFGLFRGIVHHGAGIQPARVQPTNLFTRVVVLDKKLCINKYYKRFAAFYVSNERWFSLGP